MTYLSQFYHVFEKRTDAQGKGGIAAVTDSPPHAAAGRDSARKLSTKTSAHIPSRTPTRIAPRTSFHLLIRDSTPRTAPSVSVFATWRCSFSSLALPFPHRYHCSLQIGRAHV